MMRRGIIGTLAVVALIAAMRVDGAEETLASKCGKEFQKVVACLTYATGKAAEPTKECCESVSSMKDTDPACLCYVIQQVHSGDNEQVKSMGIQETRLLQLPSACKIANASITNCPKLLNLPANSPDAAIFTNVSSTTPSPTTTTTAPGGTASPTTAGGSSGGFMHAPPLAGVPLAVAILLWAFPN